MRSSILLLVLACLPLSGRGQESAPALPDAVPELPVDPFVPGPPPAEGGTLPDTPRYVPDPAPPLEMPLPGPRGEPDIFPAPGPDAFPPVVDSSIPEIPGGALPQVVPGVSLRPRAMPERTYETGCQFTIWGGTQSERSRLFTAAKTLRRQILDSLRLTDEWQHPVIIQIRDTATRSPTGKRVWTVIGQTPEGFRIEVNLIPLRRAVPGELLRENLTRAVLAEHVLRGHEGEDLSDAPLPPPDWVLYGTLELMDYRDLGRMSDTFARVFRLGRVLGVEDILNADPERMDSVSAGIYRASACGLLMTLQGQTGATRSLEALLQGSARSGVDMVSLIQYAYPKLSGSSNSLGKWWSLQLATLAQPGMDELHTPAETEAELQAALTLRFPAEPVIGEKTGGFGAGLKRIFSGKAKAEPAAEGVKSEPAAQEEVACDITEYARILGRPDRDDILARSQLALTQCLLRGHPIYRSIIREYQSLLADMSSDRKRKDVNEGLPRLAELRTRVRAEMQRVEDHLDWFEATQVEDKSGLFQGYFRAADEMEESAPQRNDPLTRYMDAMEEEFRE